MWLVQCKMDSCQDNIRVESTIFALNQPYSLWLSLRQRYSSLGVNPVTSEQLAQTLERAMPLLSLPRSLLDEPLRHWYAGGPETREETQRKALPPAETRSTAHAQPFARHVSRVTPTQPHRHTHALTPAWPSVGITSEPLCGLYLCLFMLSLTALVCTLLLPPETCT